MLNVAGQLDEVVEDLDKAIQLALAAGPRGVVCDLSGVLEDAGTDAIDLLATAGRHVRDWSGVPIAVVCPDQRVRDRLTAHSLGAHLIVTTSMLPAVSAVLVTSIPTVEWLQIAPHSTAAREARDFVTRTLMDWGLGRLVLSVGLVVSELVTRSTRDVSSEIELSIAWNLEALRLTVRDNSHDLSRPRYPHVDKHGQKLSAVAGLSRACGVLPAEDGGKVNWAVLSAVKPRQ